MGFRVSRAVRVTVSGRNPKRSEFRATNGVALGKF